MASILLQGCSLDLPIYGTINRSLKGTVMGYINVRFDEQSVPSKLLEDVALLLQALGSAFRTLSRF